MGNQLAATAAVDLANVSGDLELVAPLGAEGRNYFATFHCLKYTTVTAPAGNGGYSRGSSVESTASYPCNSNAPQCFYGFVSGEAGGSHGGSSALRQRLEYRPNSFLHASPTTLSSGASTDLSAPTLVSSPWMVGAHSGAGARGRGRGRGAGRAGRGASSFYASSDSVSTSTEATSTTQLLARERAAWHQARWRQRLPATSRPWRTIPSSLGPEVEMWRGATMDAVMDKWCRDTRAGATTAASGSNYGSRFPTADRSSPYGTGWSQALPVQQTMLTAIPPLYSTTMPGKPGQAQNIDALVAGVSGEWRSNYGNYVQLLLRSGAGAGLMPSSAAAAYGGALCITAPPAPASAGLLSSSTSLQQRYLVEDVVTKVFVRTLDDPGQAYFLKYVRQMMDNIGEQLRVVDSKLKRLTPRNFLWYSLICEGDGFCVLQRPYVAFSLRERISARPVWTAQEKLFIVYQLLEAVAHLHETYGLTHGDIKPNNVLVQSTGVLVLCDTAVFKPCYMPLDSPLLFDYYYDTDENRACYAAPEKFSDQPLPMPPLESKAQGSATYNVNNVNFDGHTASMDIFSTACVMLFLYKEEDPLTLSQVLSLRRLTSKEAREAAVVPVLRDANVPAVLHPLLLPMLCAAAGERSSARELVDRGLQQRIFPASFPYLYKSVLPRLLTTAPDMRLVLLHNQLEAVLQRCEVLDSMQADSGSGLSASETEAAISMEAVGGHPSRTAVIASSSREVAVSLLLPLLLQTLHSIHTSDEAAYRGLLCLRRCASYCSFTCLVDAVLPHVLFYVNNDAHIYGPPTRLMALRLLSSISEVIARHLTIGSSPRLSGDATTLRDAAAAKAGGAGKVSAVPEEHWALMEHLVLPCLYDVLRQAEQESTAVLVEVARRLPRLLLLARYIMERRQLLYGAEAVAARSSWFDSQSGTQGDRARQRREAALERRRRHDPLHAQPRRQADQHLSLKRGEEGDGAKAIVAEATCSPSAMSPPQPPRSSSDGLFTSTAEAASLSELSFTGGRRRRSAPAVRRTEVGKLPDVVSDADGENVGAVRGASAAGAQQYLTQLHCLLTNGWSMLRMLYNHPCVPVAAEVMRQSASTVAAFLGEERVTEDLIPLLTTALAAPLRVQRLLYPQAILLHALLQRPPGKTLRLFLDEGLRHKDDVCIHRTLHSLSVIVRSRRLPLEETMALVHQSLPLLVENRLWLREAACSVVEAAAQTYLTSDVALHLECAVRPLLMLPVPLAHLRRYASTAIRAELATPFMSMDGAAGPTPLSCISGTSWKERASNTGSALLLDEDIFEEDEQLLQSLGGGAGGGDGRRGHSGHCRGFGDGAISDSTFKDVLPAVVAVTRSYASGPAPALLHALPPSEISPPPVAEPRVRREANIMGAAAAAQHSGSTTKTCAVVDDVADSDGTALVYRPTAREVERMQREGDSVPPHLSVSSALLSSPLSGIVSSYATDTSAAAGRGAAAAAAPPVPDCQPPTPPHSIDVSPLPATLPPPSGVSRCGLQGGDGRVFRGRVAQHSLSSETAARSSFSVPSFALRPTAAALSSASVHTGAIYAAAPSPSADGIVVSAGARGEAFVWQVASSNTSMTHTRELCLLERVAAVAPHAREHTYTACQWIAAPGQRRDVSPSSASASASCAQVAFASTDGTVRVLDLEKNKWASSIFVGGSLEGGLTGLALQDRSSLLVTTAAGGLHVVDTRCRAVNRTGDEASAATSTASVWHTQLNPLDGAPSCVCPLYNGDKACAAAVGTYGGAVCLYDLRYQLCAQRVVLFRDEAEQSPSLARASSMRLSITAACVDPLSSLCRSCRPSTLEPASAAGPSLLLGTTGGAVFRLLLQHAAYWPAFQCCRSDGSAVRTMLVQPTHGLVFTGSEDGSIQCWSTDRPETSHTLVCAPYRSPAYTVERACAAERVLEVNAVGGDAVSTSGRNIGTILASLTVREGSDTSYGGCTLPRHAPDAILTLCAVCTTTTPSAYWSSSNSGDGGGGETCYLLSGARDGTLTLWDNGPAQP
ncbi:hypothetical protein CUR178_04545 [Leishmania enriettii]|uniref:non-specific serine/threonine protein kinase n=1 Tax=Leishmania enriettii TaxID=5663 RepID=A0A836H040_LEIEN|nr:hypothetical protein CUR178_04545 [Leishmania enriettii]